MHGIYFMQFRSTIYAVHVTVRKVRSSNVCKSQFR